MPVVASRPTAAVVTGGWVQPHVHVGLAATGVSAVPESPLPTAAYSHDPDWVLVSAWVCALVARRAR